MAANDNQPSKKCSHRQVLAALANANDHAASQETNDQPADAGFGARLRRRRLPLA